MSAPDDDAIAAVAELVGRAGGRELEIGYLHDGVPVAEAGWYGKVTFRGARIIVEDQAGPGAAPRRWSSGTCSSKGPPLPWPVLPSART